MPGGLVKPHERPRAAAEREIREELGLSTEAARSPASQWSQAHPRSPRQDDLLRHRATADQGGYRPYHPPADGG
ncbi:NUDIX domain-containing protein [Streptomyces sp. NBC_01236]|uniref:NUDIX domain-containing protein n=1 Tax=Streptomyces sp. NBC_01236 TaxID=2903789 RepID=UPI003FA397A5